MPPAQVDGLRMAFASQHGVEVIAVPCDTSALARMMRDSDALLLAMDSDREESNLLRLSMPTKLPSYLVAGVPVLVLAPRAFAVSEYLRARHAAFCLDAAESDGLLAKAVECFVRDNALREQLVAAAAAAAQRDFDPAAVRCRFARHLRDAIGGGACA